VSAIVHDGAGIHDGAGFHVHVFTGDDGVPVVQIDTNEDTGRIRVNINDAPVWDGDPVTDQIPGANYNGYTGRS
jgi:hypothetical protein